MKKTVKLLKFIGYTGAYLWALLQSYLIAILLTATLASIICAIWSFIKPLPAYIGAHYGILILQGAIPLSLIFLIYILSKVKKQTAKPKEEQKQQ